MAVNRRWVKTDGSELTYAPTWLKTDAGLVVNPSAEQYRAAGWLQNGVEPPAPPEGMMVAGTRYEARDGRVVAVYDFSPIPRAPRVFSKLYLVMVLKKRGLWTRFLCTLSEFGLEDEWNAAQDVAEDFPGFADFAARIGTALGLTDAEVEEILAEAVAR